MLSVMCAERGAHFFAPKPEYLQDNGAMIAYTGLLMLSHGLRTPITASGANPNFRPDEVEVLWIRG